jgi:hypothetical protein
MFGINQKTQLNLKIGLWWSILTLAIIVGGVGLFSPAEAMAQEGIAATETPGKMAPATQGNAFVEPPAVMAAETIAFSQNSVVTGQPFQLTMDSPVGGTIRYTTNGSPPQADSAPYTGAIPINTTTIIRAQVFDDHGAPEGNLFTRSYIIADYDPSIPVSLNLTSTPVSGFTVTFRGCTAPKNRTAFTFAVNMAGRANLITPCLRIPR